MKHFAVSWLGVCMVVGMLVGVTGCSSATKTEEELSTMELGWIKKPDGTVLCQNKAAEKLESVELTLKSHDIPVFARRRAHDGKDRPERCGHPTGWHNFYRIELKNVEAATKLGFVEAESDLNRGTEVVK